MKTKTRKRRPIRLEPLEGRTLMSVAGSLDPSFGNGYGTTTFPYGVTYSLGNTNQVNSTGVAVQADGKIVVGGEVTQNFKDYMVLTRFDADGSPDTTFGQGGTAVLPIALDNFSQTASIVIQPDGKILEAGSADIDTLSNGVQHPTYLVARFNTDGSVDTSFGTNGLAEYPTTAASPVAGLIGNVASVLLQADGKIVLAGTSYENPGVDFAAVRLDADGSLDTSFGTGGTVVVPIPLNGYSSANVTAAAIQADGKIVLVGDAESGSRLVAPPDVMEPDDVVAAVRLNADGSVDTTYGGASATGGVVILPADPSNPATLGLNNAVGAAIQADGKLLISGSDSSISGTAAYDGPTLYRLNADGTLDTTFGTAGRVTPAGSGSVVIQADGKILLGGLGIGLIRLNPDGTPDATFGDPSTPGQAAKALNGLSYPYAYAVQPSDGKIVVAGTGSTGSGSSYNLGLKVERLLGQAATVAVVKQPAPFNLDGSDRSDLAIYLPSLGEFAYRPTTGGPDVFVPFGQAGTGNTIPAIADYDSAGTAEIGAYIPSIGAYAYRPASGAADVITYIGLAGAGQTIPAPADYDGIGHDEVAVYLPAYAGFAIEAPDGGVRTVAFGVPGIGQSIPTPGDYFGTGQADISVYIPSIGAFAIRNPNGTSPDEIIPFGLAGAGQSIPVPGDYDGSGKTELAVYLPSLGLFAYRPANGGPDVIVPFGQANDGTIPVPGDYSGSGHTEIAVFDPNYASFAYRPASNTGDVIQSFGAGGVNPLKSLPVAAPPSTLIAGTVSTTVSAKSVLPGGPVSIARRASLNRVAQANPVADKAGG